MCVVIIAILAAIIVVSTLSCMRAASKADKWIEEIMRRESDNE